MRSKGSRNLVKSQQLPAHHQLIYDGQLEALLKVLDTVRRAVRASGPMQTDLDEVRAALHNPLLPEDGATKASAAHELERGLLKKLRPLGRLPLDAQALSFETRRSGGDRIGALLHLLMRAELTGRFR